MKDVIFDDFQNAVDESLLRHRSILDIVTKFQESQTRTSRAVAKAVTRCGCIELQPAKHNDEIDGNENDIDIQIESLKNSLQSHMSGKLCENCREVIEREMGNNLFYLTSLCNLLDLNLYDILIKEYDRINTLGKYSLR